MAILDSRLEFSDAQDVSQVVATYDSTNVVDMTAVRDLGNGQPVYLVWSMDTALVGTSSTMQVQLRSDSTASVHDTTSTLHYDSGAIAEAVLTIGKTYSVALPTEGNVYERFLMLKFVIGTATTTAGTVSAYLTLTPPTTRAVEPDATN